MLDSFSLSFLPLCCLLGLFSGYSTEMLSFMLSVSRFSGSFLNEANFLIIIVGLTVKTSFVLTSLSYFNSRSISVGAIWNENLSPLITEVIFATM